MSERLPGCDALVGVVCTELVDEICGLLAGLRDQRFDARAFLRREVEVHAARFAATTDIHQTLYETDGNVLSICECAIETIDDG